VVKASACALEEPMEERTAELSPVDKVVCLQSVDVFKYATTEMLAYVGSIAHEEFVVKGQVIFTEDEISEAMYVVVSGGVRVDRAGIEILNVGPGQSFGTWGLFDNQPRKMTATTLEDTRLLKIRSDDFYDLLADHDEITPAVFKAVIERVNRLIED
jgi:CRP-like cAMP-binding protein